MRYASSILNGLKLAAAEGRLLSIGELFGRAWQLGKLLAARKEPADHGKWCDRGKLASFLDCYERV
jgi:hypothetical protein